MKYTEDQYIGFMPFFGEDSELSCQTIKILKTRKPHACVGSNPEHTIPTGSMARYEKALVDGDFFGRYYMCIPCLDKEMSGEDAEFDD